MSAVTKRFDVYQRSALTSHIKIEKIAENKFKASTMVANIEKEAIGPSEEKAIRSLKESVEADVRAGNLR